MNVKAKLGFMRDLGEVDEICRPLYTYQYGILKSFEISTFANLDLRLAKIPMRYLWSAISIVTIAQYIFGISRATGLSFIVSYIIWQFNLSAVNPELIYHVANAQGVCPATCRSGTFCGRGATPIVIFDDTRPRLSLLIARNSGCQPLRLLL